MGTRKESRRGMPAASAKASRIWDMGFRIWDLGLVVLAVLLIIFSCLDTRFWLLDTRYFMMHGPGHQPPSSQGHDYGPAGKAKLLNKQFFLIKIRNPNSQIPNRVSACRGDAARRRRVICHLSSDFRHPIHRTPPGRQAPECNPGSVS